MRLNKTGKRLGLIIVSVLLLAAALVVSLSAASFQYNAVKDSGRQQQQLTRKIAQVGGVWAQVKIVSGVISILSTIQVEGSIPVIGGLAVSAEPLGWTDVVDNTLDHISDILLWAMGALVIEKMLLAVSVWVSLKIVVPLCALFIVIAIWNKRYAKQLKRTACGIVIIAASVCAAIPLSLELSTVIETSILSNEIQETVSAIEDNTKEAERAGDEVNNSSFIDTLKGIGKGVANFFSAIKETLDSFIDQMINYIMCFILTNILIPIGTLFGLKYTVSTLLRAIDFFGKRTELQEGLKNTPQ